MSITDNLYERLTELLGENLAASAYLRLLEDLGDVPERLNLPHGITSADDRASVLVKLGLVPSRSRRVRGRTELDPEDYWDDFAMGPLVLTFIFDGRSRIISSLNVSRSLERTKLLPERFTKHRDMS